MDLMHYSVSFMPQFRRRKNRDDEPNWCMVAEYEPGEPQYILYPKGRNYLLDPGTTNLTMTEAE